MDSHTNLSNTYISIPKYMTLYISRMVSINIIEWPWICPCIHGQTIRQARVRIMDYNSNKGGANWWVKWLPWTKHISAKEIFRQTCDLRSFQTKQTFFEQELHTPNHYKRIIWTSMNMNKIYSQLQGTAPTINCHQDQKWT